MTTTDNATPHPSAEYDRRVRRTIPFYETMQQEAVDLVRTVKPAPSVWLDTGCGTGYLPSLALPLFPDTRFLLADPSAPMMRQARQRLCDVDGSRIEFLDPAGSADLEAQLASGLCQVVTSILCHHYLHAPEREEAVRACHRLLAPGGLFVTFEIIRPRDERGVRIGLERWGRFQVASGRSTETVSAHLERFDRHYFPLTLDEHFALMHEIGFRTVEIFWLSHIHAGLYAIK